MIYQVETTSRFDRDFKKLDRSVQLKLKSWIQKNLVGCENPRLQGKALTGSHNGLWRYRVGSYRLIADIQDEKVIILLVDVGRRREIYR